MNKAVLLGFGIGSMLFLGAGFAATRPHVRQVNEELRHRANLADATPVQIGVMTDQQRAHSRLFQAFSMTPGRNRILDEMARAPGEDIEINLYAHSEALAKLEDPKSFFKKLAREADAVIRATVLSKESQALEDMGWAFTDYRVEVLEVLKQNEASRLVEGAEVIITRPGGKLAIGNVVVTMNNIEFKPLRTNSEVLLFLKFVPETRAYATWDSSGSFEVDGTTVKLLTGDNPMIDPKSIEKASELLRFARTAVSARPSTTSSPNDE
jgi:hypothetical protein